MGRRSLAEQIWEGYADMQPGDITWLIIYDFKDRRPRTKFYENLERIKALATYGEFIQQSVYATIDRRAALSVKDLAEHYGAQVYVFKAEEVNI